MVVPDEDLSVMSVSENSSIAEMALSPDDAVLVTGSDRVRFWDVATGILVCELETDPALGSVRKLSFSPDGRRLAISHRFGATIIDSRTGATLHTFKHSARTLFGPEGRHLLVTADGISVLHDADTYEVHTEFDPKYRLISFDEKWRRIVTAQRTRQLVSVRDFHSQDVIHQWTLKTAGPKLLYDQGRKLAVPTLDLEIVVLDVESGDELGVLRGHTGIITSLAILPGHDRLVSGSRDRTIRRWDTRPVRELLTARQIYEPAAARLKPIIGALFEELGDATQIADLVEADSSLTKHERQIALQLVLKTSILRGTQ